MTKTNNPVFKNKSNKSLIEVINFGVFNATKTEHGLMVLYFKKDSPEVLFVINEKDFNEKYERVINPQK